MRFRRRYEVVMLGHAGAATSQLSVISQHRSERDAREAAVQERRRLEVIHPEDAASWVIQVVRGEDVIHEERPFDGRPETVPVPPVGPLGITQTAPRNVDAPAASSPDDDHAERAGDTGTLPAVDETALLPAAAPGDPAAIARGAAEDTPASDPTPSHDDTERPGDTGTFPVPAELTVSDDDARLPAFLAEPGAAPEPTTSATADEPDIHAAGGRSPSAPHVDHDDEATGRVARKPGFDDVPPGPVPDDIIRRFEESIAREQARAHERGGRGSR